MQDKLVWSVGKLKLKLHNRADNPMNGGMVVCGSRNPDFVLLCNTYGVVFFLS
ncbi:hypothetical protein R9C00_20315 [Flammeovirgaceae bacterium SG7u.111]|nr:hypothetical protein R9C00_20315 [Flammeovirgaceae bacterium SG7u.111]